MEGVPPEIDVIAIERTIRGVPGVADVHDLHVWSITEGFPVVTVHVVLANNAHGVDVAERVGRELRREHGLEHVTVQPEAPGGPRLVGAERLVRPRRMRGSSERE
jgi:cobalt-zinc-cadmium efflux system protein